MRNAILTVIFPGIILFTSSYCQGQWQLIDTPEYNNTGNCSYYYNGAMASNFRVYWAYSANCPAGSFGQFCEYEIFATADLGASWYSKEYENNILTGIQAMDFISGDTGYFVHYMDGLHSQVYRTSDYLTSKNLVFNAEIYDYRDLAMISYNDLFMIDSEARVFHLENDTFQLVYDLPLDIGGNMGSPDMVATSNHYLYIACKSFVNGTYADDLIIRSHDGGLSWDTCFLSSSLHLNEIMFATDSLGFAVGDSGIILRTQDAADTWSEMTSGVTNDLLSLDYMDDQTWLLGGSGGLLLISEDSGDTWEPIYSPTTGAVRQLKFPEKNQIVMIKSGSLWRANLNNITNISRQESPSDIFTLRPNPANYQTVLTINGIIPQSKLWTNISAESVGGLNTGPGLQTRARLMNATGDLVDEFDIKQRNTIIHLNSYPSGIYFLMIQTGERVLLKKLIIR